MILDSLAFIVIAFLGLGICFLGYRAFLVLLPVWGLLSGIWLGTQFGSVNFGDSSLATVASWALGIIFGLILAALAYWLFKIGFTLIAAIGAGAVASAVLTALEIKPGILNVVMLVVIIGTGALISSFHVEKYAIILLTAVAGADLIVLAFLRLYGAVNLSDVIRGNLISPIIRQSWISVAALIIFAGLGVVVQTMINRNYQYTPRLANKVLGK